MILDITKKLCIFVDKTITLNYEYSDNKECRPYNGY